MGIFLVAVVWFYTSKWYTRFLSFTPQMCMLGNEEQSTVGTGHRVSHRNVPRRNCMRNLDIVEAGHRSDSWAK